MRLTTSPHTIIIIIIIIIIISIIVIYQTFSYPEAIFEKKDR